MRRSLPLAMILSRLSMRSHPSRTYSSTAPPRFFKRPPLRHLPGHDPGIAIHVLAGLVRRIVLPDEMVMSSATHRVLAHPTLIFETGHVGLLDDLVSVAAWLATEGLCGRLGSGVNSRRHVRHEWRSAWLSHLRHRAMWRSSACPGPRALP